MATTNFPDGVTNVAEYVANGAMPFPDPTTYHTYFNDFDQYVAADWTVTETQAGATQALTAGDGGLMLLTNSAADNDVNQIQKAPSSFLLSSTKKAFFACRFKVSDATQSDLIVGLVVANTDPINTPPTDGIYFLKSDGAATVDAICRKNTTTGSVSQASAATMVTDTFIILSWYYDGAGTLYVGVDGTQKYAISVASYFPDTTLAPMLCLQNGEAVAKTMTIDYVFAAAER